MKVQEVENNTPMRTLRQVCKKAKLKLYITLCTHLYDFLISSSVL